MTWKVIKVSSLSSTTEKSELYCNLHQNSAKAAMETMKSGYFSHSWESYPNWIQAVARMLATMAA